MSCSITLKLVAWLNPALTQNASDAAAAFERDINSFYVQDQWQVNDSLTVVSLADPATQWRFMLNGAAPPAASTA